MHHRIRAAVSVDIVAMVDLSDQHRRLLQSYQPVFWRKAERSKEAQIPYFEKLIADADVIKLVAEGESGIEGFLISARIAVPPVYDPGTITYLIDDFCVKDDNAWMTVGSDLLQATTREIKSRGGGQIVVVCPHLFEDERAFLRHKGLSIASEWYVSQI